MTTQSRTVLITGAAKRVGKAIALELATVGYDIALHYNTSRDEAEATADLIRGKGVRCEVVPGDLSDGNAPAAIVEKAVDAFGQLDVLVNNASIFPEMRIQNFDLADWDETLRVNLTSPAALCHYAAPHLAASKSGVILNLCDVASERPWARYLAYSVSKAGLVALTKALAKGLSPGVRVVGISPGIAEFPDDWDQDVKDHLVKKVPLKRPGTPEEIAAAARFLIEDATYVTGHILTVDGGSSTV